jgi:hypothetical protein
MVVVDMLTKSAHFILVKIIHKATNIAKICIKEISRLHGVPKAIMSDIDPKFNYNFWKGFFNGFGTNLNFGTTYYPELDGKINNIN